MNIFCRLGKHYWGPWARHTGLFSISDFGIVQRRICNRCEMRQERVV